MLNDLINRLRHGSIDERVDMLEGMLGGDGQQMQQLMSPMSQYVRAYNGSFDTAKSKVMQLMKENNMSESTFRKIGNIATMLQKKAGMM